MNKLGKNKIFISCISLFSLLVVSLIAFLSQNCCFFDDDLYWGLYYAQNENVFDCLNFNSIHGGGYIGLFLCKFFMFKLPLVISDFLWGVHPADFMCVPHGVLRGVFVVICFLLISKFIVYHFKSKLSYLLTFIYTSIYFFISIFLSKSFVITVNYNYYRYFFSLIFFSIFLYYLYKNVCVNYKKTNYFKLLFVSFCGFVVGTSVETESLILALFVFFVFSYNILLKILSLIVQNKALLENKKFNLNKNFYIPSVFLYLAIYLFISNVKFKEVFSVRGVYNITVSFDLIKDFTKRYIEVCFVSEVYYWIVFFLVLMLCIYYSLKQNELKKVLFPCFLQISILTVMYSLIVGGKDTFYITNEYWLMHVNIRFLYKIVILYPLLIMMSYLLKSLMKMYRKSKRVLLNAFNGFLCLLCVVSFVVVCFIEKDFSSDDFHSRIKTTYYINEKMIRFYTLMNQVPHIQNAGVLFDVSCLFHPQKISDNYYSDEKYFNQYYLKIYKNDNIEKLEYYLSDNAIEKFYKNGGTFSESELASPKFSRLYDEEFVLNKRANIDKIKEDILIW